MKIKLHWNPWIERWIMRDMLGNNMYEFPDCSNFKMKYPDLSKNLVNIVEDTPSILVSTYPLSKDFYNE